MNSFECCVKAIVCDAHLKKKNWTDTVFAQIQYCEVKHGGCSQRCLLFTSMFVVFIIILMKMRKK